MFWYTAFDDDETMDFETFAEAESWYDNHLMQRWKDYQENDMAGQFEEDKKYFDLGIIKKELIVWPE